MYVKNLSQHLKNHKQQQIADDRQPSLAKVASKLHNRARPPLTNNKSLSLSPARHLCSQRRTSSISGCFDQLELSFARIDNAVSSPEINPARLVLELIFKFVRID